MSDVFVENTSGRRQMKQIRALVKLGASGIVSLVLLSAFCVVFSFSGVHVANPSGATDYKWQSRQWKSTMTEGFSWMKMDGRGFNNPDGVSAENPECLIMGSSHMEAVNVSSSENVAAQLRTLQPGEHIFAPCFLREHERRSGWLPEYARCWRLWRISNTPGSS